MSYPIIIHGSENSLDIDAYVIVPEPLSFNDAKKLCDSFSEVNSNLLVVTDGVVSWSYKGTVDECNNSILATYALHEQAFAIPVERALPRVYALKMLRTIRGLLSHVSRTHYRDTVKEALKSADLAVKISALRSIDLSAIESFEKNPVVEVYKFFAFQLGQTLALLEEGVELFTKNSVAERYPELGVYLRRETAGPEALTVFWERFVSLVETACQRVDKHMLFVSRFQGVKEVFDCKAEQILPPVVVFDIDGTLMDERHRSHLRQGDTKDWESYFALCHLDTPIDYTVQLSRQYREKGYEIWAMSGRSESCLSLTKESLDKHGVCYDHIKLRGEGNRLPDYILKPSWIAKYIGLERVEVVYDDLDRVIEGFRKKGLNVVDIKEFRGF